MKKKLSILIALAMAISLCLVPAVMVAANPGSYSTDMGKACWSVPVDFTAEAGLNWNPLGVDVTYADGQATFVITPPIAFNPEAPNDNFWLAFDTDNDGVEDFLALYNTRLPSEDPSQTYSFHWAEKTYNGGWSDYQEVPGDWDVSETGLSEFTVSIPVSYLGGVSSDYGFQMGLVKYVHMDDWDDSWGAISWDPNTCGPWSTHALIFVPLPSEGWESETIPANTEVGLTGEIEQITAINVYPTSIDFGTITPGTPVSGDTIAVTNIGTVSVTVSAEIDPTGGAFQYLFLNDVQKTGGSWSAENLGMGTIAPTLDADCTTELQVPVSYSAQGSESTTLAFVATPATP